MISIFKCKDGSGIFKRSVLEGGLGFGISRDGRHLQIDCDEGSVALTTSFGPKHTEVNCQATLVKKKCKDGDDHC